MTFVVCVSMHIMIFQAMCVWRVLMLLLFMVSNQDTHDYLHMTCGPVPLKEDSSWSVDM